MKSGDTRKLLAEVHPRPPSPDDPPIDGMKPSLVLEPESVESAARALALCRRERLAVVPVGGGSRLHIGNLPARLDVYLSTVHLEGVLDYEPADSTVTVDAGTPLASLQRELGHQNQFLPWDAPRADRGTVGGILAAGEPGFRRRPGARPRDLLLGFEGLLADGTIVKAGGRVVKNVSGYDLMRLMVGSRGTLALVTRAHLRVRPLPETTATWAVSMTGPGDAVPKILRLRKALVEPEVLAVVDPGLGSRESLPGWTILLRYEGLEDEVVGAGNKTLGALRSAEIWRIEEQQSIELWRRLRDFPAVEREDPLPVVVRGQSIPSRTHQLVEKWQGVGPLLCYPENGLVYARTDDPEAYSSLLETAREQEGNAVLEAGPPELKAELDVFGEIPGGYELMRRIKEKLDPAGIFSPGRFVGRL